MNTRAKSIKIIFDNSSEDRWEATCAGGIEFDDAMRMIARAWKECDEPREPYIKDKRIRKAVRVWAEINSIERILYAERPDKSLCCLTDMGEDDYAIEFVGWIPTLKDSEEYTIAELCGNGKEDDDEA